MLVPKYDASGAKIGSIPSRASKNPVIGVIQCDCGAPATVHNPKGKRKGYLYTQCDNCKTDQRSGQTRQDFIKTNMVDVVEQLPSVDIDKKAKQAEPAPQISEPENPPKGDIEETAMTEMGFSGPNTPSGAVLAENPEPEQTEPETETQAEPQAEKQPVNDALETVNDNKAFKVAKAGIAGALLGVLFGLIA